MYARSLRRRRRRTNCVSVDDSGCHAARRRRRTLGRLLPLTCLAFRAPTIRRVFGKRTHGATGVAVTQHRLDAYARARCLAAAPSPRARRSCCSSTRSIVLYDRIRVPTPPPKWLILRRAGALNSTHSLIRVPSSCCTGRVRIRGDTKTDGQKSSSESTLVHACVAAKPRQRVLITNGGHCQRYRLRDRLTTYFIWNAALWHDRIFTSTETTACVAPWCRRSGDELRLSVWAQCAWHLVDVSTRRSLLWEWQRRLGHQSYWVAADH